MLQHQQNYPNMYVLRAETYGADKLYANAYDLCQGMFA